MQSSLLSRWSIAFLSLAAANAAYSQTTFCTTSAGPPLVRAEGVAERTGDLLINCAGPAGTTITGNFTFILSSPVTNRLSGTNTLAGITFSIDSGSGPQAVAMQPLLVNQFSLVFDGVAVPFSGQGTAKIVVSGIRVNATGVPVQTPITEFVAINLGGFPITTSPLVVGTPERGLYASYLGTLICAQNGSPLPDGDITFTSLIDRRTAFASTRFTEGFADAFGPKSAFEYQNADSGQRIIVTYSGFPSDARLFVPDVIAGSDATQPTAGGDFEIPASGGSYAPSVNGSLLLARVAGANANGAGGTPVYMPGAIGSGTVTFDSVSEIDPANGTAYVVYEVVDANPFARESAQFPLWLGLKPDGNRQASTTSETINFAPVSSFGFASATEPLPRFEQITPLSDCAIIGDCGFVQGILSVDTTPLSITQVTNNTSSSYFMIRNKGGGMMPWIATIAYTNGSGWAKLDPASGDGSATVFVYVNSANLAPGTYQAAITVNAGPAGTAVVPLFFTVTAPPPVATPPPPPVVTPAITSVLNGASLQQAPVVPGSITTLMGSAFTGKNISATFNGQAAAILFSNDTQINLVAPQSLSGTSASLVVTVDGVSSAAQTVPIAAFAPAIFANALLNQDGSANSASNAAAGGSEGYFFATGLSGSGQISVRLGDRELTNLAYAGPAPTLNGVQQVNFVVPLDLSGAMNLYVCGAANGSEVCSPPLMFSVR